MPRKKLTKQDQFYITVVLGCCDFIGETHGKEGIAAEMAACKIGGFDQQQIQQVVEEENICLGPRFWEDFNRRMNW